MSLPRRIPTLSLFSGAGGLDIGFHRAGYEIVACVEIQPHYCETLISNVGRGRFFGPGTKIHSMDIRAFDPSLYLKHGIEVVIGGPPCQTFSAAGRRSGGVLGTDDPRGQLFRSYIHALDVLKPKAFVFENVYGLKGANGGGPWREICGAFGELGYSIRAEILDSADYGTPQHRERMLIVGHKGDGAAFHFPMPTHGPDSRSGRPLVSVLAAIQDLQQEDEPYHEFDGLYGHLLSKVPEGLNYSFFTREMGHPEPHFAWRSKFHDFLYKVDRNSPSRTIKAQPGKFTGPFHWKNRHFTVPELKRLQGFPDAYDIVGSYGRVVEQIGNSVPPHLAEAVAKSLLEQILRPTKKLDHELRPPGFKSTFRMRQRERTHTFKDIAKEQIRSLNIKAQPPLTAKKRTRSFFAGYQSMFKKEIATDLVSIPLYTNAFHITEVRSTGTIDLSIESVDGPPTSRQTEITISGLGKYLDAIDTLTCRASLADRGEIFHVWDLIQDALTYKSRFFTLIDIYGHYANRGDTVRVKTKLLGPKLTSIDRGIEFFGNSMNCGVFVEERIMANAISLREPDASSLIRNMRAMRWDIRNKLTHATIQRQETLCTYPFPLLSEKAQIERRNDGAY